MSITLLCLAKRLPPQKRMYHWVACAATGAASFAYLYMAVGFGVANVDGRPIYYARYIDWSVTTPLILFDHALLLGFDAVGVLGICICDFLMIISGLVAALIVSGDTEKFLLYGFSCACLTILLARVFYALNDLSEARPRASLLVFINLFVSPASVHGLCRRGRSRSPLQVWTGYPIVWLMCEGTCPCREIPHPPNAARRDGHREHRRRDFSVRHPRRRRQVRLRISCRALSGCQLRPLSDDTRSQVSRHIHCRLRRQIRRPRARALPSQRSQLRRERRGSRA